MLRKIIHISALDSPNVKSGQLLIPGLITKKQFDQRLSSWDSRRIEIGLYGRFPSNEATNMFPRSWFERGEFVSDKLDGPFGMGIDPAEGGDSTVIAVVNKYRLINLRSLKTPDTSVILGHVIELRRKYKITSNRIYTDRGGGGRQLADYARLNGINIRTVAFNESVTVPTYGVRLSDTDKTDIAEQKYVYANRRASMYGELSETDFYIPDDSEELIRQLSLIPKTFKGEKLALLPKRRKVGSNEPCLEDILGCSPDEADALVLAYYACTGIETIRVQAGAV